MVTGPTGKDAAAGPPEVTVTVVSVPLRGLTTSGKHVVSYSAAFDGGDVVAAGRPGRRRGWPRGGAGSPAASPLRKLNECAELRARARNSAHSRGLMCGIRAEGIEFRTFVHSPQGTWPRPARRRWAAGAPGLAATPQG